MPLPAIFLAQRITGQDVDKILGGWAGKTEINKLYLDPVSGQGKRRR